MIGSSLQIRHNDVDVSLYFSFNNIEFFISHGSCVIKFPSWKYKTFVVQKFINEIFSKDLNDWEKMIYLNTKDYILDDIELCKIKYIKMQGF